MTRGAWGLAWGSDWRVAPRHSRHGCGALRAAGSGSVSWTLKVFRVALSDGSWQFGKGWRQQCPLSLGPKDANSVQCPFRLLAS